MLFLYREKKKAKENRLLTIHSHICHFGTHYKNHPSSEIAVGSGNLPRVIAYIKKTIMCSVSSVNGFGFEYKELLPNIGSIVDTAFQNLQMISYWLDQIKMQCISKIK